MAPTTTPGSGKGIGFGLIFFSSNEGPHHTDKYRLVIESAKFADQHGFSSVWIPERHFTKDGWLYPNPAVLQAALARETRHIHLRAGSVVVPLHNPLRIAEEWAMVDNLSGGRVGLSFASGWHPNDFALFPENYERRNEIMYRGIEMVRKLWRGESVQVKSGDGSMVELRTYPPPVQPELPFWVTAAGNPKTFAGAGEIGANLLTHMYNQSVDELAEKIRIYRDSRAAHGYDPATGLVSVMLHTYVGPDEATVRAQLQGPFCEYLKSASYLVNAIAYSRGQKIDMSTLSEQDLQDYLLFVFDRLVSTQRVLFGTPESCAPLVAQLQAAGVNEIACQMDFGVETELVLESMPYLQQLKERQHAPSSTVLEIEPQHDVQAPVISTYQTNGHAISQEDTQAVTNYVQTQQEHAIPAIQQRCREEVVLSDFYATLHERGIQLAASFQGINRLWRRDGEALGQISLPTSLAHEIDLYQIHPTLLDACLQVMIATLPGELFRREEALYLPTGIRSFRVLQKPGERVWSHAQLHVAARQSAGLFEGDVRILDEQGRVLAEALGLQLMRSEPVAPSTSALSLEKLDDWLYELQWEPAPVPAATVLPTGRWLIFQDGEAGHPGVGQQLVAALERQGISCVSVTPGAAFRQAGSGRYQIDPTRPEDVQQLIQAELRSGPLQGIVHLWSLNSTPVEATSLASLESDQRYGVAHALSVLQALIQQGENDAPHLWLVTRGAQHVTSQDSSLAVAQSPLWGLGKTCAMEHAELWGGLIDLDPAGTLQSCAEQLLTVLTGEHKEDQVAFRRGQSYVARMVRSTATQQQPLTLRRNGSYLITGGLWGLGLEVARWLAEKGARHLILLGRSRLPERASWDQLAPGSRAEQQVAGLRALEAAGAHVHYVSADVADEGQMTHLLRDLKVQGFPPICGVMHAASVWQDAQGQSLVRPLANLTPEALSTVFRPKVLGGWLLHTLLKAQKLDFFVSFSSGASLFGSAAQGNYAAAGEFLDILAHYQRAQGQPALSIDWGAVSEIGFGATSDGLRVHEYWETRGIQRITPRQVLAALELLIPQSVARVGVLKLDWRLLKQFYGQITRMPLVAYLVPEDDAIASTAASDQGEAQLQALLTASEAERLTLLQTYLREQVAQVLRVPAQRLDIGQPLTSLGLDSLMAIELKNRIEVELKVRIPIVTFLQGPSIEQFSLQVLELFVAQAPVPALVVGHSEPQTSEASAQPLDGRNAEDLLSQLDDLSDAEVDALLSEMMTDESGQTGRRESGAGPEIQNASNGISPQEAEHLLDQLDQLSDDQVDSLLNDLVQKEE